MTSLITGKTITRSFTPSLDAGTVLITSCVLDHADLVIPHFHGELVISRTVFRASRIVIEDVVAASPARIVIESCTFADADAALSVKGTVEPSLFVLTVVANVFTRVSLPVSVHLPSLDLTNASLRLQGNVSEGATCLIETNAPAQILTLEDDGDVVMPLHHEGSGYRGRITPVTYHLPLLPLEDVSLPVVPILQDPELPTGCEITSLAIVMKALGLPLDKVTLADQWLPKKAIGEADPWREFVGNPHDDSSYGCYAPVIARVANDVFAALGAPFLARAQVGACQEDLQAHLSSGIPVIVWATMGMRAPHESTEWRFPAGPVRWRGNQHCLVLTGMNDREERLADPQAGLITVPKSLFALRNEQYYAQSVVFMKK